MNLPEPVSRPGAAASVESTLAGIARGLHQRRFRRFVVTGGETPGAVVTVLGARLLELGPELPAGVSWMAAGTDRDLLLALKSGNFGADDLLIRAADPASDPVSAGRPVVNTGASRSPCSIVSACARAARKYR